jgi:hypothetical protein
LLLKCNKIKYISLLSFLARMPKYLCICMRVRACVSRCHCISVNFCTGKLSVGKCECVFICKNHTCAYIHTHTYKQGKKAHRLTRSWLDTFHRRNLMHIHTHRLHTRIHTRKSLTGLPLLRHPQNYHAHTHTHITYTHTHTEDSHWLAQFWSTH